MPPPRLPRAAAVLLTPFTSRSIPEVIAVPPDAAMAPQRAQRVRSKRVKETQPQLYKTASDAVDRFAVEFRKAKLALDVLLQRRAAERAATGGGTGGGSNDVGDNLQQDPDCPICFDTLTRPSTVVTRCGHLYHNECILKAIKDKSKPVCPLCRSSVHRAELKRIMNGIPEVVRAQKAAPDVVEIDKLEDDIIDLTVDQGGCARNPVACGCGDNAGGLDSAIMATLGGMKRLLSEGAAVKNLESTLSKVIEEKKMEHEQLMKDLTEQHKRALAKIEADRMDVRRKKIEAEKAKEEAQVTLEQCRRQAMNITEKRATLDVELKNIESKKRELQRMEDAKEAEKKALVEKSVKMDRLIEEKALQRSNKKLFEKYKEIATLKRQLKDLKDKKPELVKDDLSSSDSDFTTDKNSDDEDDSDDVVADVEEEYAKSGSCKKRARSDSVPKRGPSSAPPDDNHAGISLISTYNGEPLRAPKEANWPTRPRAMQKARNLKKRSSAAVGLGEFAPKRATLQRPAPTVAKRVVGRSETPMSTIGQKRSAESIVIQRRVKQTSLNGFFGKR